MKESLLMRPSEDVSSGEAAFLGEVPTSQFITGTALANQIGLSAGASINYNTAWLKFTLDRKTLYVAKKPFRHTVSWDQIHARGAVFGTRTVVINGSTYKVRLLKGANNDPTTSGNGHDPEKTWGSEWNRLLYPLVPNLTNQPDSGISGEGIEFGSWANYTVADLGLSSVDGNWNWCQENNGSTRVLRGVGSITYFTLYSSSYASSSFGWRPILELVK